VKLKLKWPAERRRSFPRGRDGDVQRDGDDILAAAGGGGDACI